MSGNDNSANKVLPAGMDLLGALGAAQNWQALALTVATLVTVVVLTTFSGYLASKLGFVVGMLFSLVALAAGLVGYSAVGAQLLAEAREEESLSFAEAIQHGLASVPRLVGVALTMLALVLALVAVLAIVLFVCKIPYLGNVLYAVVLPVGSVIVGVVIFAVFNVSFALMAPAIWDGSSVFGALSRLLAVVRQRPLEILVRLVLLGMLVGFTAAMIGGILLSGYLVMQGLAAAMEVGMNVPDLNETMLMQQGFGHNPASLALGFMPGGAGGALGSAVLFAIGATLPMLILIKGLCIVYLRSMADIDVTDSDALLRRSIAKAREGARQASERAAQMQASVTESVSKPETHQAPTSSDSSPLRPRTKHCIHCNAVIAIDDVFCGECGKRSE